MLKKFLLTAAATFVLAGSAIAQTAPASVATLAKASPAAGVRNPVLIADITYVLLSSEAGKYRSGEIDKIRKSIEKEIEPQAIAIKAEQDKIIKIEGEMEALEAAITSRGGVPQKDGEFLKRMGDYQTQLTAYQKKEQEFAGLYRFASADQKATEEASIRELGKALNPVIKSLVAQKNADVLLNASPQSVAYFVDAVDVSDELLAQFNTAVKTIPVVRQRVPREAPANAAASAKKPASATGPKPVAPVKP
jgi:Skp family chaperone for outer membrane proteins